MGNEHHAKENEWSNMPLRRTQSHAPKKLPVF